MEPSVEEKFNDDLWYILQKIRKQSLYSKARENITYEIPQGFFGTPYNDDEEAMMKKLYEWGVITLEETNGEFCFIEDRSMIFTIKTINPKFAPLYRLFENALKEKIDAKHIFDLRQELIHPIGQDKDLSFELWRLTKKSESPDKKKTLKIFSSLTLPNIQFIYGLSAENRSKMKRIIELIQNKLELAPLNRLTGIFKIPIELLKREGFTLSEAELLIETIDRLAEHSFIKVDSETEFGRSAYRPVYLAGHTSGDPERKAQEEQYLTLSLTNAPTLQDIKDHLEAFEKRLQEMAAKSEGNIHPEETSKPLKPNGNKGVIEIYYDQKSGIGEINSRKFKIKPSDSCADVFASLYGTINLPVKREEVLISSNFYEEGQTPDPARRSSETLHINEIAKTIRRILKVDVNTLVNNDGNLTLFGVKIKSPKVN